MRGEEDAVTHIEKRLKKKADHESDSAVIHYYGRRLSGGQLQRACICRSMTLY